MAEVLKLIVNLRSPPPTPAVAPLSIFCFFHLKLSLSSSQFSHGRFELLALYHFFAQMEPIGSKGGTWKAMGGRSVRWRP
uniref:Uncharacterized protein n=1 Tax=Fagus sylvatica TaxID=28930 RepID=A0A2N9GEM3_FAGSY